MEFTPMDAAQYRALSRDEFVARRNVVIDLLNAETLPEGIDLDNLLAEADIIDAEVKKRNALEAARSKVSAHLDDAVVAQRQRAAQSVLAGEGNKVASTRSTGEVRDVTDLTGYTDSQEYRAAFARHILHQERMSGEVRAKALQSRANTPVVINADYTNMTDTFSNMNSGLVVAPMTLSNEVIREAREAGVIFPKVTQTSEQGQYGVSELDLIVTGAWIGDKEVSPYHGDYDPEVFNWTWHQFEARFSRTMLAEAVMRGEYKAQLAPALAECYANAMDAAVLSGNGTSQPKGIINDVRLVGSDGNGKGGADQKAKALVVDVTEDDVNDWKFWASLLWTEGFNRMYRNKGELVIADGTWGNHIAVLHDDNNRPITDMDMLQREPAMRLRGVGLVDTVANDLLPSFDTANVGDIIGVYGNFTNYVMNFQPGLPLNTVSWDDHETNTHKTKMLLAADGRVANPFGWLLLRKGKSA